MIRAYDEYGNIVDLVEWENHIRANAIDDLVSEIEKYYFTFYSTTEDSQCKPYLQGINLISQSNIKRIAERLKASIDNRTD